VQLQVIESRQFDITRALQKKFHSMHEKVAEVEKHYSDSVQKARCVCISYTFLLLFLFVFNEFDFFFFRLLLWVLIMLLCSHL
jgi:hypothetical protein